MVDRAGLMVKLGSSSTGTSSILAKSGFAISLASRTSDERPQTARHTFPMVLVKNDRSLASKSGQHGGPLGEGMREIPRLASWRGLNIMLFSNLRLAFKA